MSILAEQVKSRLIGTPVGRWAQRLHRRRWRAQLARDPKLEPVSHEAEQIDEILVRMLRRDSNCVDAGAHLGGMLAEFVRLAPGGRHVAIEPTPRKAGWIRRKWPRVEVIEAALSDAPGEATFYDNKGDSGFSGLRRPGTFTTRHVDAYPVRLARLDDLFADRGVDFLKIDVEGAELSAFRGGRELLRRCRPTVLFECTNTGLDAFGVRPADVYDELCKSGYEIFVPGDWLARAQPLSAEAFAAAMGYPFRAFNFVAMPRA